MYVIPLSTFPRFSQGIGGGWIEARNSRGEVGLVPEDYVEVKLTEHTPWGIHTQSQSLAFYTHSCIHPTHVYKYSPCVYVCVFAHVTVHM